VGSNPTASANQQESDMPFVSPEQAKKMRCCKPEFIQCKADDCMGWRWKPKETRYVKEDSKIPDGWVLSKDEFDDDLIETLNEGKPERKKYLYLEKVETEKVGYCGLAGYPSKYD